MSAMEGNKRQLLEQFKVVIFVLVNIASGTGISFANKIVFSVFKFNFVFALTLIHVITTMIGLYIFSCLGWFERKRLPFLPLLGLAVAFCGYIVMWNSSLQISTVGFTQLAKICNTPGVMIIAAILQCKMPTFKEIAAILVLCIGVALATVADSDMATNFLGIGIAFIAVAFTSIYQVWAGSRQKEYEVGSMALMFGYTPIAIVLLVILVVTVEPSGLSDPTPDTLLGYPYTLQAVGAIALTALLGFIVSLSTFLVIGATSSTTFTVLGHSKMIIVLGGGCLFFGESLPPERLAGVCLALTGMGWYSHMKLKQTKAAAVSEQESEKQVPQSPTKQPLLPKV